VRFVTLSQFVDAAYAALRLDSSTCFAMVPFLRASPNLQKQATPLNCLTRCHIAPRKRNRKTPPLLGTR
jgi:hypothetical protein